MSPVFDQSDGVRRLKLGPRIGLNLQARLTSPEEVRSWFVDRAPMVLPPHAVPLLDAWGRQLRGEEPPSIVGWKPVGPGRSPVDAAPLIAWLRTHAESCEPFTFNALYREPQGGRMYPFAIDGYDGPLTISRRQYEAAGKRKARRLLSAIRRDVRALLRAPVGWSLLELDFKSCHAAIGVALSGDEQLANDVHADAHQVVGDAIVPQLGDAAARRHAGKALNNRMLFGGASTAVRELAVEVFGSDSAIADAERVWTWWWSRYPRLAAFRDELREQVIDAQNAGDGLTIEAPSGRLSKFTPGEVAGRVVKGKQAARGPGGVWRSIMSACFRAVEGDLLDATLRHFHDSKVGGQLVLPLYDGGLFACTWGSEGAVADALRDAGERAAKGLGLYGARAVVTARTVNTSRG